MPKLFFVRSLLGLGRAIHGLPAVETVLQCKRICEPLFPQLQHRTGAAFFARSRSVDHG